MGDTTGLMSRNILPLNGFGVVALVVAGLMALTNPIGATQNPVRRGISSGGNVSAQSATHRVSGTVGQIASGRSQSPTHAVAEGIWNTLQICDCPYVGDIDTNSTLDILDVIAIINAAFRGGPLPAGDRFCPNGTRADLNCDAVVDVFDVTEIIDATFRSNNTICNPCDQ